ncbi:hypothetical protein [Nostoc sp. PA-18-2419]|uniref:hypothetical protein n=1 Tax=Nostoc sp. PA-18-2419 TaxID=2575443 RepID=UPI001107D997|nr:hypothetical protein [Nostoc sp. PA-18-2419]
MKECLTVVCLYTHPKLWEWLSNKIETAKIEKQRVGVWLENLRVMTGEAIVITSECWSDYGLLLGAKQQLLSLVRELEPRLGLAIIMSPDFLLAGVVVVQTGETITFSRGTATSWACGEVYFGFTGEIPL